MQRHRKRKQRSFLIQASLLIFGCTFTLTFSFFGVFSIVSSETTGIADRMPFYVIGMATVFVGLVVYLEEHRYDARTILVTSAGLGATAFVVLLLSTEGLFYAASNPGEVMTSKQFPYLIAAGMITTGFGYWILRHWQEVVGNSSPTPRRRRGPR